MWPAHLCREQGAELPARGVAAPVGLDGCGCCMALPVTHAQLLHWQLAQLLPLLLQHLEVRHVDVTSAPKEH
jgi:hypothetical protein